VLELLVDLQTTIHHAMGDHVSSFARRRDWSALLAVLPVGILFGAVHALTPGHNKLILATYAAGNRLALLRAVFVSMVMTITHIGSAVILALVGSTLISRTLVGAGRAPAIEATSHILLIAIGAWMIWSAVSRNGHGHGNHHGQGIAFGLAAGLIPCPLTLFVMVFALANAVPEAGLVFAATMIVGVGGILTMTGIVASLAGRHAASWLEHHDRTVYRVGKVAQVITGMAIGGLAIVELIG
jgi:ABC-type nickel/cobalt efflux system permease component RcnA